MYTGLSWASAHLSSALKSARLDDYLLISSYLLAYLLISNYTKNSEAAANKRAPH